MINRRKFLMASASGAFVCAGRPSIATERTTLEVAFATPYLFKDPMDWIVRQFELENPNVAVKLSSHGNYTDLFQFMIRAALTGGVPDVGFHGLTFVRALAERQIALPVDSEISAENNWASLGYSEQMTELAAHRGQTYGLPFAVAIPTVYYNEDRVRAAGADPDNLPTTWEGIIELAKKMNADGGSIFFDYAPTGNWTFIALVESQGGRMISQDETTVAFDSLQGVRALEILAEIGDAGFQDMTRDQAKQAFGAGSLGILVTSSSDTTHFEQQSAGRFNVRVGEFPVLADRGRLPAGGNAAMIHTTDPTKRQLAWQFIKFASGPRAQAHLARETGYMPVNNLALENSDLLDEFYKQRPNLLVPVRQRGYVGPWFSFPGENGVKITKVIENHLRGVLLKTKTPVAAMTEMAHEVQALLET